MIHPAYARTAFTHWISVADSAPPAPTGQCSAIAHTPPRVEGRMPRARKMGISGEPQVHVNGTTPESSDIDLASQLRRQPLEEGAFCYGVSQEVLPR
jgi:hypothetical protein